MKDCLLTYIYIYIYIITRSGIFCSETDAKLYNSLRDNWTVVYASSREIYTVAEADEGPCSHSTDGLIDAPSIYIYIYKSTVVEGDPNAPFSIATTPRCCGGYDTF